MSLFRYVIFPDRTYTLEYKDMRYEVLGQKILDTFEREAFVSELVKDWLLSSDHTEPDTSYFVSSPDADT